MITIRSIQSSDIIPSEYWPLGNIRPGPLSLISTDSDNKITGVCWIADGGEDIMVVLFTSASPKSVVLLWTYLKRYAKSKGFSVIITYVSDPRIKNLLRKRGWVLQDTASFVASTNVD